MKRFVIAAVFCLVGAGCMSAAQKEEKCSKSLVQGYKLSEYVAYHELLTVGKSPQEIEDLAKFCKQDVRDEQSGKYLSVSRGKSHGYEVYTISSKRGMLCVQKTQNEYIAYRHVPLVDESGVFKGMSQGLPLSDGCLYYTLLQSLHQKQSKN